jgi:hypothetical protein
VLHAGESEDDDNSCICYIEDNSPFEVISPNAWVKINYNGEYTPQEIHGTMQQEQMLS